MTVEFEYDGIHELPLPRGGQIWEAPWPLCWSIYLVSGRRGFLGITDPREQGSMVWEIESITGDFHPLEWWHNYFTERKYVCKGQLRDIQLAQWDAILAMKRGGSVPTGEKP